MQKFFLNPEDTFNAKIYKRYDIYTRSSDPRYANDGHKDQKPNLKSTTRKKRKVISDYAVTHLPKGKHRTNPAILIES